jgi:hypothetical protein
VMDLDEIMEDLMVESHFCPIQCITTARTLDRPQEIKPEPILDFNKIEVIDITSGKSVAADWTLQDGKLTVYTSLTI